MNEQSTHEYNQHIVPDLPPLRLKPIISYPRVAEAGQQYLLSIDVQLADGGQWPYKEEEFEISFILDTAPFFTHEPLGEREPGIVLHRFGGTYGAAEYLLTTSKHTVAPGTIKIVLLNGWGLPITQLKLDCEVKHEAFIEAKKHTTRKIERAYLSSPPQVSSLPIPEIVQEQYTFVAQQLSQVGWKVQSPYISKQKVIFSPGYIALRILTSPMSHSYLLVNNGEFIGLVNTSSKVEEGDYYMPSSVLLKRAREARALTREEVAEAINVNPITILRWESGASRPNTQSLNKLCLFYGKSATELGLAKDPLIEQVTLADIVERTNLTIPVESSLSFIYFITNDEITFHNALEPAPNSRKVSTFHQPSTLATWLKQARNKQFFRSLVHTMPQMVQGGLFDDQFKALQSIEQSLANNHPRTLVQIENGMGQTHITVNYIYRLLTHTNAKHILYVINGPFSLSKEYALASFQRFTDPDDKRNFTERYQVRMIADDKLDPSVHVHIGTLDDLYYLYSAEKEDERLPAPLNVRRPARPEQSVKDYCPALPIEFFDAIFLVECEFINYANWQPLLDYFDTFYIGIASDLSDDLIRFFNNNIVYAVKEKDTENIEDSSNNFSQRQKELAATVRTARNLLRNDAGLSYEADRASQLAWLLFLKNLDDFERTQEVLLKTDYVPIIERGYRWRDWATSHHVSEVNILKFVNDDLIPYLAHLRGKDGRDMHTIISTIFQDTTNRIRSGHILREVVDKLDVINFNSSDDIHAVSLLYETTLQELHSSMRDASEFYTPRPVIRFIIDCLQPQLGERILDPACGTGGFLVEAYAHLARQIRTPEQRRLLQDHVMGIEKKPMPYLLAVMNMLLHGIEAPNITQQNALTMNIQQIQDEDYIDLIVTNPPFGGEEEQDVLHQLPGGTHRQVTQTPLLFMWYIMQTLKRPGGRCGMISPNGFLFWDGIARRVRRDLLTRFNLHTIIRLPEGIFSPYTTIPTNILFFEASQDNYNLESNPATKEVWYYKIPPPEGYTRYSKTRSIQFEAFQPCLDWWDKRVENEHAWKVPIEHIFANDCNLNYNNPYDTR